MSDLSQALRDLVSVFDKLGTPYAVMGGLAVRVHGIPRPTYDVDFTAAIGRDRLPEFYKSAEDLGYTVPEQHRSGWVDEIAGMPLVKLRMYLDGRGVDVDVFLAESPFQKQILARRQREDLGDGPIWIVSAEDLILLKLVAGRPRDIADVGDILFTQGQLDGPYLRRWAEPLDVLDQLEIALGEPPSE